MQKILSVPRMKCVCYSRYVKKCKFLSENLWNVLVYPLAWEFFPLTKFITFYVKKIWKKVSFSRDNRKPSSFFVCGESSVDCFYALKAAKECFYLRWTRIKSSLKPNWQLWNLGRIGLVLHLYPMNGWVKFIASTYFCKLKI